MSRIETIQNRHSVRSYLPKPIEGETLARLQEAVDEVARTTGLAVQLVRNNPEVFNVVARYGVISGCSTSIVLPERSREDDETLGYHGQGLVLLAQELGLNTCWVMMCSRKKSRATVPDGQKIRLVIAVGYGTSAGGARKTKSASELVTLECAEKPAWFDTAVEAAQLAPTAVNQQKFHITLKADARTVEIVATGKNLARIDLGIIKRNFVEAAQELGADFVLA